MNKIYLVIGLGFGDCGKGATVNSLCSINPLNTLVIRTSGGHQVGHTVRYNNILHAFSNFGSGTLQGVPTYWSEYCTVNPMAVIREGNVLKEKGIIPIIIYNANAMVTTPFDIIQNRNVESKNNHGTVGVGFGTTIQRNEDNYHLYVRDLYYPRVLENKLKKILNYYGYLLPLNSPSQRNYGDFIDACREFIKLYPSINNFSEAESFDKELIFEGGQGIMLDMQYGFFPNVTRSYTTSRNAIEFIKNNNLERNINTYYVSRAYQTRHGHGYMSNEDLPTAYIKPNPIETNVDSGSQGEFRKTVLDLDLMKYALSCDGFHNSNSKKYLVMTCCDQIDGDKIPITIGSNLHVLTPKEIAQRLNLTVIIGDSDKGYLHY